MTAPTLPDALTELTALSALEADWDGEDAPPLDPTVLATARGLVERLGTRAVPDVAPCPDGGVGLSWEIGSALLWMLIAPGREVVTVIVYDSQGVVTRWAIPADAIHPDLLETIA